MAFTDITNTFRVAVNEKREAVPEHKRRKLSKQSKDDAVREGGLHTGKEYIAEAYTILNHINTLTRMLQDIRKPYLTVDARNPPLARQAARNMDISGKEQSWAGIRHLSNEERDQIDLQARVVLTRCSDRIKEMEALEKRRTELVASQQNPLVRFLPTRLKQNSSTVASDFVAAHHSSVTWYLSRRLTETSQSQKEMQEERVKRQLERTRTLGSSAAQAALTIGAIDPLLSLEPPANDAPSSWFDGASSTFASGLAATIGAPSRPESSRALTPASTLASLDDEEDDDLELSQSQILQFETENAHILRNVQDTLESVQQAESRLMDISALQMELVTHLSRQTELTDQLYEDAIATTVQVEKGNAQLKEAKRRSRDSRKFILLFLVGASLSLLFLHYY